MGFHCMTPAHRPASLAALASIGHGFAYLVSLCVARMLGVEGFESYVVGSTAFILMVTIAPLGFEKYSLRLLPVLFEREDWPRAKGYLHQGFRCTLVMSLLLATGVAAWAYWISDLPTATRLAIVVSCLSLPAGALVHYALEVVSATGHELRATAIFRIAVPGFTLVMVGLLSTLPVLATGSMAVACWGMAWVVALLLMALQWRKVMPRGLLCVEPLMEVDHWNREARPFWIYRVTLALLAQAGVLALVFFDSDASAVGAYAAAMGTAGLAAMLATATNRTYARRLSVLLEQRDFTTVMRVRRERLRWLLPAVAIFLMITFAFSRQILGLFRPEFVEEGVMPLRLLALSTAFSVVFALSPTYLKYARRKYATYYTVACTALLQLLMLVVLVPRLGATGAAAANATSMIAMYGAFAWMASREVRRLQAGG